MTGIVASSLLATLITHQILKGLGVAQMPASECIAKARSLTLKARAEYVSRFTTAAGDADVDTLLEDLPTRGSAAEAKRFLESNRNLQTAEALYKKAIAIEAAGWVPGDESKLDQQVLNTAIAHNQLGYNYRLVGDLEKALESLGEVYGLLDQLPRSASVELERASVDFHFGLVMMACYRRLGHAGDRSSALNLFQQSIERLAKLGYDSSGVQKLAGSLDESVDEDDNHANDEANDELQG
jgi:tetratricopeptide (TPR) repeat protein